LQNGDLMDTKTQIIAILMQAGDDEYGIPRIVFQVNREDLKRLKLAFYQKRLLTVSELPPSLDAPEPLTPLEANIAAIEAKYGTVPNPVGFCIRHVRSDEETND